MSRIEYPSTWAKISRDELDTLFDNATEQGLWFFHQSLAGVFWFSPEELNDQQQRGNFIWGAPNWKLRDPREYLDQVLTEVQTAQANYLKVRDRLVKAGVL